MREIAVMLTRGDDVIRRTRRRALALLPVALLAATLSGCAQKIDNAQSGGGLQLINQNQLLTCTHLPYEPFQFSQDGKVVGFDVDLVDLVAKELGVTQKIKDTPFEGIKSGENLNARDCDIAAAGMSITQERQRVMDFSQPYFDATQALLVRKSSTAKSLADLRGKTVGVQLGTTGELYAQEQQEKFGFEIKQYEDLALLQGAVKTGQIAGGINDDFVLYNYVETNPDTKVSAEFDTGEQYGFAVRKGNKALLDKVNQVLRRVQQDGTYDRLYRKWFDQAPNAGAPQ